MFNKRSLERIYRFLMWFRGSKEECLFRGRKAISLRKWVNPHNLYKDARIGIYRDNNHCFVIYEEPYHIDNSKFYII